MRKNLIMVCFVAFVLVVCQSFAGNTPLGGLAVTVSPDGKALAAAGDNRTLYLIDADKLAVTKRAWLGTTIVRLSFNKDASTIVAEDTSGCVSLIDAKTQKVTKELQNHDGIAFAEKADLFAALTKVKKETMIKVYSMTDFSEKASISVKLENKQKAACIGISADGATVAFFTEPEKDSSEPKNKAPKGMKGVEKEEFKLKNDGKTSVMTVYDVASAKEKYSHKTYYSAPIVNAQVTFEGENVVITNYSNINAKITPNAEVSIFQFDNSFNYGLGYSADQSVIMSGGLAKGQYTNIKDVAGKVFVPGKKLAGWPEYFKGFDIAEDGTGYGCTSGYRIIAVNADGTVKAEAPIY